MTRKLAKTSLLRKLLVQMEDYYAAIIGACFNRKPSICSDDVLQDPVAKFSFQWGPDALKFKEQEKRKVSIVEFPSSRYLMQQITFDSPVTVGEAVKVAELFLSGPVDSLEKRDQDDACKGDVLEFSTLQDFEFVELEDKFTLVLMTRS
jgi:hypothetical protein